ncbi:hypothetical protein [Psychrobacillus sp. FSL H8-0487]|uniref:hypothetical protein n=1 Tax=Psychrobacillus sp. FSL H8-0487 TaxID=2921391 RepID=UPI0030FBBE6F
MNLKEKLEQCVNIPGEVILSKIEQEYGVSVFEFNFHLFNTAEELFEWLFLEEVESKTEFLNIIKKLGSFTEEDLLNDSVMEAFVSQHENVFVVDGIFAYSNEWIENIRV